MLNEYKYIVFMVIKLFLLVGCILRKLRSTISICVHPMTINYFKAVTISSACSTLGKRSNPSKWEKMSEGC